MAKEIKITDKLEEWFTWEIKIEHWGTIFWTLKINEPLDNEIELSYFILDIMKDTFLWNDNWDVTNKEFVNKFMDRNLLDDEELEKIFMKDFKFTLT